MHNSSAFQYLAIDTIHESTTNPRHTFYEGKLRELAASIKHRTHSAHHRSQVEFKLLIKETVGLDMLV